MATMYWYAINTMKIESITHNFLETGHTQNENATHAAIERTTRKALVVTSSMWSGINRNARPSNQYHVKDMMQTNFLDFKEVAKNLKNYDVTEQNESCQLDDIKKHAVC